MTAGPKKIFHDTKQRRWTLLKRFLNVLGVLTTFTIVTFIFTAMQNETLPKIILPRLKRPYQALSESPHKKNPPPGVRARKLKARKLWTSSKMQQGIRVAYYVIWDAGSFSALRAHYRQVDLLFPEWLHVLSAEGNIEALTPDNRLFLPASGEKAVPIDSTVLPFLKKVKAETQVLPLVNNFDPISKKWTAAIGPFLKNPESRARFLHQAQVLLASGQYHGLSIDFEEIPLNAQEGFSILVADLYQWFQSQGMKLYLNVPVDNRDYNYAFLASHSDGLIVMNYDQHNSETLEGPIAAQEWFKQTLRDMLKSVPKEKIICALGNYGYDWISRKNGTGHAVRTLTVQEAWLEAMESESPINFDPDTLNPNFAFMEEGGLRHTVWFLDAATVLNQMRGAETLGIQSFALWRLGAEDQSLWSIWDEPENPQAHESLRKVLPGQDVDLEGRGEILNVTRKPQGGERTVHLDGESGLITDQKFISYPTPYQIAQYGAQEKMIAITFDDGPDPVFTPQILDVLKKENVKATFFLIGLETDKYPRLAKRIVAEGHEIGNHTFTHPDISDISRTYMRLELNLTERLFASLLGVKPILFRPPYSIDQEPDTADQVKPLEVVQDLGYITVGSNIDPNDWRDIPGRTDNDIAEDILRQLPRGNIILLHDGGGDRAQTVRALPMIVGKLRERGYRLVAISELLGKGHDEVMPRIEGSERAFARVNWFTFSVFGMAQEWIAMIFFIGNVLITLRLLLVGTLAVYDRFRRQPEEMPASALKIPAVVVIPSYNEEKVIEKTVRSSLNSDYENFRVMVVDDGSTDGTLAIVRRAFKREISSGRLTVLSQPNSGKAEALNLALSHITEEIYVGIDADTAIARDAVRILAGHFQDPRVAAVAGNVKVGNRVNLWTNWQALEYITSQNFERRALNVLKAISVVPGAIGAWRTEAVRQAGCYHPGTVAEDADLTMSLLQAGHSILYDDRAVAYTEAPRDADGLMRQRFRWSFGILQAVWKHRSAFFKKGTLGRIALPNIVIFQILLPLFSPLIDLMFIAGSLTYVIDRHYHPDASNPASFQRLLLFFAIFMFVDMLASVIAFILERKRPGHESDPWLLSHLWLQRFAYRQIFSVVIFKTLKRAVEGKEFEWDKLERNAGG